MSKMRSLPARLLYYMVIKPVSLLPFPVLYILSDFLFFVIYLVIGYRKRVVFENLQGSFPEKSNEELLTIQRKFYRHFCDLIVESLKLFSASGSMIEKRMRLINPELPQKFYKEGKSMIVVSGHYGNWEWAGIALPNHSHHKAIAIFLPLTSDFFNKKLIKKRGKTGLQLVPIRLVKKHLVLHKNELYSYSFINDQSPSNPARAYWVEFLKRQTAMFTGAELYAKEFNLPVLYAVIQKVRRGHYTFEYKLVAEHPSECPEKKITEDCARINEEIIRAQPEYWLWTHRRWKHKKENIFPVND